MRLKWYLFILLLILQAVPSKSALVTATDVADSFKSMMGKTSLEKFQEIREVGGKVLEIAATFIPYGKTVLAMLKLIKSDKGASLNEVMAATKRIEEKIGQIRSEQAALMNELLAYHLEESYRKEVTLPLIQMFELLAVLEAYKFNPPQNKMSAFMNGCNINFRPQAISAYLKQMVEKCGKPELDHALVDKIYAVLLQKDYIKHLSETDMYWFNVHVEAIYNKLFSLDEYRRGQAFIALQKLIDSNLLHKYSGLHLIETQLVNGDTSSDSHSRPCLLKSIYLKTGFKREQVLNLATTIYQDLNQTIAMAVLCSNITNPNNSQIAEFEAKMTFDKLEPVASYLSEWVPQLLNSSWAYLEGTLVKRVLITAANKTRFPRNNQTYDMLRDRVMEALEDVGHPLFERQTVIISQLENTFRPPHSDVCFTVAGYDVHIFVVRTFMDDSELDSKVERFGEFVDNHTQVFQDAMPKMRTKLPVSVVKRLGRDYGFSVDALTDNSFYLLFMDFNSVNRCDLAYSVQTSMTNNKKRMRLLTYKDLDEWSLIVCTNHVLILAV